MRTIATTLVGVMLLISIVAAVALTYAEVGDRGTGVSGDPSGSPGPTAAAPSTPAVQQFGGLTYGEPGAGSPTNRPGQSRLWFNDEAWWGVFLTHPSGDHRIFRLDGEEGSWIQTDVIVDDRSSARMDVLWDGSHLVVASAGEQPEERHALRIYRFSYDGESAAYVRDANFPVIITERGVETVTVARSSDGRLWVAYRNDRRVALDHTLGSDLAWRGPFVPEAALVDVEQAVIAAVDDQVALVWTVPSADEVQVVWHDVTQADETWLTSEAATVGGLRLGDDALSVAVDPSAPRPRILAAVRTSADEAPNRRSHDPQLVVAEFVLGRVPRTHLVSRVDDRHGPPAILVDGGDRSLRVIASVPAVGGDIVYHRSPLDEIVFSGGRGTTLISANDTTRVANPTSTKQIITAESGMLVAATDTLAGEYVFGGIGVPSIAVAPGPERTVRTIVEQTFDGLTIGSAVRGWELEGPPFPAFVVSVPTATDSAARLTNAQNGTRACLPLRYAGTARLIVEWRFLFNLDLTEELRAMQARGGGELASLRVQADEVRYFDGATLVRSDVVLVPGRWYRVTIALEPADATYDLVVRGPSDEVVLDEAGLHWRAQSTQIGRICAELPAQAGLDLYLDDVTVKVDDEGS